MARKPCLRIFRHRCANSPIRHASIATRTIRQRLIACRAGIDCRDRGGRSAAAPARQSRPAGCRHATRRCRLRRTRSDGSQACCRFSRCRLSSAPPCKGRSDSAARQVGSALRPRRPYARLPSAKPPSSPLRRAVAFAASPVKPSPSAICGSPSRGQPKEVAPCRQPRSVALSNSEAAGAAASGRTPCPAAPLFGACRGG
jgi:hypothetical protein